MVTHDLDLAKQCDKVLYIGQDYQTMYGSHDELMQNCSSYGALIKAVNGMGDESRAEMESLV